MRTTLVISCLFFHYSSSGQVRIIFADKEPDSSTYSVRAEFKAAYNKNQRINLVKVALVERERQLDTMKMIKAEEYMDKKYLTYRYRFFFNK